MDELVFKEKSVQRVFEYLQKNNERKNIFNKFQLSLSTSDTQKSAAESDADECLQCILM